MKDFTPTQVINKIRAHGYNGYISLTLTRTYSGDSGCSDGYECTIYTSNHGHTKSSTFETAFQLWLAKHISAIDTITDTAFESFTADETCSSPEQVPHIAEGEQLLDEPTDEESDDDSNQVPF